MIAACETLDEILEAEGRVAPSVVFGKLTWTEQARAPRIAWEHHGGSFTSQANVPSAPADEDGNVPTPSLGYRVARTRVALWHISPEHLEHMLERLWLATSRTTGGEAFRWQTAVYEYPTETEGPWLQNGHSVIVLSLPVEIPVAGEFDGETTPVEITSTEIRTGIESPAGEDITATAYEENQWVTPDVHSES